jgi:hypothetical protein
VYVRVSVCRSPSPDVRLSGCRCAGVWVRVCGCSYLGVRVSAVFYLFCLALPRLGDRNGDLESLSALELGRDGLLDVSASVYAMAPLMPHNASYYEYIYILRICAS